MKIKEREKQLFQAFKECTTLPDVVSDIIVDFVIEVEFLERITYFDLNNNMKARLKYLKDLPHYYLWKAEHDTIELIEENQKDWHVKLFQHKEFITFPEIPKLIRDLLDAIKDIDILMKDFFDQPKKLNLTFPIDYEN